ncbi:MAG: autotransporter domain-containing protein [Fusobacterium mortiferum]|nr:autotransporter domain-containing protein [Fusobacterium mortiferum]
MKRELEKSLKRYLKRKVRITLGFVTAFAIMGNVGLASEAIEGSLDWSMEKAKEWTEGYDGSNKIKEITGDRVSISEAGEIKLDGTVLVTVPQTNISNKVLTNINNTADLLDKNINGNTELVIGNDADGNEVIGYNEGLTLQNIGEVVEQDTGFEISGEGNIFVNDGELNKSQKSLEGATIVNKGEIAFTGNNGQNIGENGIGYNYGIVANSNDGGQNIETNGIGYNYGVIKNLGTGGQNIKGIGYNYGIISNGKGNGQRIEGTGIGYNYGIISNTGTSGQEIAGGIGYNYGIISNKSNAGQNIGTGGIGYNYGVIANGISNTVGTSGQSIGKGGIGYNYGIIANTSHTGQSVLGVGYNYGVISNKSNIGQNISGVGYNYGLISNQGSFAQNVAEGGVGYNYGIIANTSTINIASKGNAYNYGVVKNTTGAVFEGKVDNYGIVIYTTDSQNGSLGTGTNKGVVLDSTYTLVTGKNSHVADLSSTGSISGNNDKTYYTKDKTIDFSQDLTGNVLTAVITGDDIAYNYNGSDELVLNNSVVTGYFTDDGKGTLLNVSNDLVLVNSTVNAVTDIENRDNVTAVKLDGGTLTQIGDSQIVGKIEGQGTLNYVASQSKEQVIGIDGELTLRNATSDEVTNYGITDNRTDISFSNLEADKLVLNFVENTEGKEANEIVLGDNVVIGKAPTERATTTTPVIDGSSSTEKIDLTINDITGIHGDITLGSNDDTLTIAKNYAYDGVIDLGNGTNDILNLSHSDEGTTHVKNEENTFNYKVHNVEKINLTGGHWHIDNTKTEITGDKVNLNISGELHVEVNSLGVGKGVETSMDGVGKDVNDFTVSAGEGIKFVVGDNFNALEPSYSFETEYKLGADTEIKGAVIFDTSASTATGDSVGHINIRVKEADELGLGDYAAIYDTVIKNLSENDALRNAINYQDGGQFQDMIKNTDFQASAFYTTGYAVTKDVTDMYMDTVESFGRKAGAGEWLAFGKYLSSDTEFDGGSSSRGYDGDITGTVGMVEYGVNDTTSYGVVFGKGDTEIDITGGGKLDGDNTYIGGYVKHTTEGGIELLGNIGFTKSDLDAKFSTHDTVGGVNYNIISDGSSDADAITLSLKAKKPYSISETLRVEPMLGARYTLINQDAVESSDRNFRIDERDVTVLEGMAGADLVKDFSVANGKLSLKTGVEVSLLSVSDSDDARYTLYGNEIALVNEEEIADSKVSAHVGFGYEHENGVGVDARYKFIWTDKGDSNRAEVGLSYRF